MGSNGMDSHHTMHHNQSDDNDMGSGCRCVHWYGHRSNPESNPARNRCFGYMCLAYSPVNAVRRIHGAEYSYPHLDQWCRSIARHSTCSLGHCYLVNQHIDA